MAKDDLVGLLEAQERLTLFTGSDAKEVNAQMDISFRDMAGAVKEVSEAMEKGEMITTSMGRSTKHFTGRQVIAGEALAEVDTQIETVRKRMTHFQGVMLQAETRTAKLAIMMEIQAAQAREDTVAVRDLALNMAILGDVNASLTVTALKAAEAIAIQQVQMMNMGLGSQAAIRGVKAYFDTLEDTHAPQMFHDTLAKLNLKMEETTGASTESADAAKAIAEADTKAKEAALAREQAADLLSQAMGERAVVERDYAKAVATANELVMTAGLTEVEVSSLIMAAWKERGEALDEIQKKEDDAVAAAPDRLKAAGELLGGLSAITSSMLTRTASEIADAEERALSNAEGNLEEQEKIRARFDARRQEEMATGFAVQKGLAIASATVSGAQATIGALAPPPTGFGGPLGMIMAGVIAATTAAEIAVIASQQPAFHHGGVVGGDGDQAIMAQGGEVVLNRNAVAGLGGTAAANDLNRGGGGRAVIVQMTYKQKVFDQVVVDNLAKGGPLKSALSQATRRGRRGRVGGRL